MKKSTIRSIFMWGLVGLISATAHAQDLVVELDFASAPAIDSPNQPLLPFNDFAARTNNVTSGGWFSHSTADGGYIKQACSQIGSRAVAILTEYDTVGMDDVGATNTVPLTNGLYRYEFSYEATINPSNGVNKAWGIAAYALEGQDPWDPDTNYVNYVGYDLARGEDGYTAPEGIGTAEAVLRYDDGILIGSSSVSSNAGSVVVGITNGAAALFTVWAQDYADVKLYDLRLVRIGDYEAPLLPPANPVPAGALNYQMDDTVGTVVSNLVHSGADTGQLSAGPAQPIATDGIGNLVWTNIAAGGLSQHNLDDTYTDGQCALEFHMSNWQMAESVAAGSGLGIKFKVGSGLVVASLEMISQSGKFRIYSKASDGADGNKFKNLDVDSAVGVTVRMELDLDAGTYDFMYKLDSTTNWTVNSADMDLGSVTEINTFKLETSPTWGDPANTMALDYVTFEGNGAAAPTGYDAWIVEHGLTGAETNRTADVEPDGMDNLLEFALGGDPNIDDAASVLPTSGMAQDGGTNWLEYVYNRRVDHVALGLEYNVETVDDLVLGTWTNDNYTVSGIGSVDAEFDAVTNRIDTTSDDNYFIGLTIQEN